MANELLKLANITVRYPGRHGKPELVALDDVSLTIYEGETLGLVGESGSGKTTLGQVALSLLQPTSGEIAFAGQPITKHNRRTVMDDMQLIFQDPYESLNPKHTALELVREPLRRHFDLSTATEMATQALAAVGLTPADGEKYPVAFSGGQRQRIGIARAIVGQPKFIVADEPISALDVSIQAQVLSLMMALREQQALTYLFISHDLSKVQAISDRVAVLYFGHLVELGPTAAIFENPLHPYTQELLAAIPSIGKPLIAQQRQTITVGTTWVEVTPGHFVRQ